MITTFENRCVLQTYLIVMRPIFCTMHKGVKQVEKYMLTLHHELVLFLKIGIFFVMYHRMRSKGTSWAGPCHYLLAFASLFDRSGCQRQFSQFLVFYPIQIILRSFQMRGTSYPSHEQTSNIFSSGYSTNCCRVQVSGCHLFQHTPVVRCRIPSGLLTILTCLQVPHSQKPSDHTYLIFTICGILHCIVCIFQCYDWSSLFPSFHLPVLRPWFSLFNLKNCLDSCQRYGMFTLIFIASVTTGLPLVLINNSIRTADYFQALSCSLLSISIAYNTLVYWQLSLYIVPQFIVFAEIPSLLSLWKTHFVNITNSKSTPVVQESVGFHSWQTHLPFLFDKVIIMTVHPLG